MASYQVRTFKDIVDKICEQLKIQKSDTESRNRIKRNINAVYLDEVLPNKSWSWRRKTITLQTEPYFGLGTASVEQNSNVVVLSQAPATSQKGNYFSVVGGTEIYRIASHTAGSTTLTLETKYAEVTLTAASYRVWKNSLVLPADCYEISSITHQYRDTPVDQLGYSEYVRLIAASPKAEGRPSYACVTNFKDPEPYVSVGAPASILRSSSGLIRCITFAANIGSYFSAGNSIEISGCGEQAYNIEALVSSTDGNKLYYTALSPLTESDTSDINIVVKARSTDTYDNYRELLIHPSLTDKRTTLAIDYLRMAEPLEDDSDEPIIPLEDRIVLFYGGMWMSCDRERNPEWAKQNFDLFQNKLARMAGRMDVNPDKPMIKPGSLYLQGKRSPSYFVDRGSRLNGFGGMSSSAPTGTANSLAVFGSDGTLIASPVSTNEVLFLDGTVYGTGTILPGASGVVLQSFNSTLYKHAIIFYGAVCGVSFKSGTFHISSDGSTVGYADGGSGSLTDLEFSADISSGSLRWLYSASTGGAISYKIILLA